MFKVKCCEKLEEIIPLFSKKNKKSELDIDGDIGFIKNCTELIREYGQTPQEAERCISAHLISCKNCRESYLMYLDHMADKTAGFMSGRENYLRAIKNLDVLKLVPIFKKFP